MLKLKNITKHYNNELILQIPGLQLTPEIHWIKGANGSGKTTLLKMIASLLPFDGDIEFKGISLKNKPIIYRRNISWAEAEPLLPSFLSGKDLINLYASIRKASGKECDFLLELFNLNDCINSAIGTYSAGMTKKLSLALAFVGDPSLIILDEPLITLDPDTIKMLSTFILERYRSRGTTFLLSSHQELDSDLALPARILTVYNKSIMIR